MILELVDAGYLLLAPLLLLLWWFRLRRRSEVTTVVPVASTEMWHRSVPQDRSHWPLRWLLLSLVILVAAAGPRLLLLEPNPMTIRRTQDSSVIIDLRVPDARQCQLQIGDEEANTIPLSHRGEASLLQADLSAGTSIVMTSRGQSYRQRVPTAPAPVRITDGSGLPSVSRVLTVLEEMGRVLIVTDDPHVFISRGGDAPAGVPSIDFPGQEGPLLLPRLASADAGSPILSGLHPRYWTILRGAEVSGEPLLLDEAGRTLLSRTAGGFRCGFLPAGGDLAERGDWPVALGRMIEALAPDHSSVPEPWYHPVARQLALLITVAAAAFSALRLGARGRFISLLLLLAVATGQWIRSPITVETTEQLEAISRTTDPGHPIVIPGSAPPPAPDLIARLRSRGVGIEVTPSEVAEQFSTTQRIRLGQSVPAGEHLSARVTSPAGDHREVNFPWKPSRAGVWRLQFPLDGSSSVLIVEDPIAASLWADRDSIAADLLPDPVFAITGGPASFPLPAAGSVIVWNGVPLTAQDVEQLQEWIGEGGTFLALPADSFCEDRTTRELLGPLIHGEIPEAPDRQRQDLGILLLDLSGSLSGSGASAMLEGATALLEGTPTSSHWGIAGFRDRMHWIAKPGTPIDESIIASIPGQIRSGGGTDLGSAIVHCRDALLEKDGGRSLVIISDGRSTPDDWISLGQSLKAARVELDVVLVGNRVDRSAVEILCDSTGGELHVAATPAEAAALLGEAIQPEDEGWQPISPPVLAASLDHFIDAGPRTPPIPRRRLAFDLTTLDVDGTVLWVDGTGGPLLTLLRTGEGVAATWYSGLDNFSLSSRGHDIHAHLSQLLAASADRRKPPRRRGFLTVSDDRQWRLCWQRFDGDPLSASITAGSLSSAGRSLAGEAIPGGQWYQSDLLVRDDLEAASGFWWGQQPQLDATNFPARGSIWAWQQMLGSRRLAPASSAPAPAILLALISLLVVSSRDHPRWDPRRQRDTAVATDRSR